MTHLSFNNCLHHRWKVLLHNYRRKDSRQRHGQSSILVRAFSKHSCSDNNFLMNDCIIKIEFYLITCQAVKVYHISSVQKGA